MLFGLFSFLAQTSQEGLTDYSDLGFMLYHVIFILLYLLLRVARAS